MRLSVASAALAAALVLAPVGAGVSPAFSQDFSITNKVEPADAGRRDLMRQLQAWWDVHAEYPKEASASDQGGTVKLNLVIQPDGNIAPVEVVQSSGSCALDTAGAATFRGAFVRPVAPGAPSYPAAVELSLHYILAHRHDQPVAGATQVSSRSGFSISNDPVKPVVVDTMLQRTCTGTVVTNGLRNHPMYGSPNAATAIFFRKPDGSAWVKFQEEGFLIYAPVTETGRLVQWMGYPIRIRQGEINHTRFTVWPEGDNRLIGDIAFPQGTVDLTCTTDAAPPIIATSSLRSEMPRFESGVAIPPAGACRR